MTPCELLLDVEDRHKPRLTAEERYVLERERDRVKALLERLMLVVGAK